MNKAWALALLTALGVGVALSAYAAPRPFCLWQSVATGRYFCTENNPGPGWMKFSGPYNNAACRDQ